MPDSVSRRPATEADIPFLLALRAQTMEPHHLAAGIEHSLSDQEARVRSHFECAEIFELHGQPVGMAKILRGPSEWRIVQIQLLPSYQRNGMGTRLINSVLAEARAVGLPLSLSVLKVNPARRLYERLGFIVVSEGANVFHMRAMG
jgi:ribosomal protein S18 acetylase RimI-like enzyme